MNDRSFGFRLLLGFLVAACAVLTGCMLLDSNPSGPEPMLVSGTPTLQSEVGLARSVSVRIVLPSEAPPVGNVPSEPLANVIGGILAESATGTPEVTIKLTLVNVGSTGSPTTTLIKSVFADASGTAVATFTGVPARPCLGEVRIVGGRIATYTEFHGAADLLADVDNTIVLSPKGSKSQEDIAAETLLRISANADLFAKAVPRLVTRIVTCMASRDLSGSAVIDDVLARFVALAEAVPLLQVATSVKVLEETIPSGGGFVTLASPGSPLDGLKIAIGTDSYAGPTPIRITVTEIASQSLADGFTLVTPLITIDDGGKPAGEPVQISVPVSLPTGAIPLAVRFDPATGEFEGLPILSFEDGKVTFATQDLSGLHSPVASIRRSIPVGGSSPGFTVVGVEPGAVPNSALSGFNFREHAWKVANAGTILEPDGSSDAFVLSAYWCFKRGIFPALNALRDTFNTPVLTDDDASFIRFGAVLEGDLKQASAYVLPFPTGKISAQFTLDLFKAALLLTHRPQFIFMRGETTHKTLLVTRFEGNTLYVYDPARPSAEKELRLESGGFNPFLTSIEGQLIQFTEFFYLGERPLVNLSCVARRWDELQQGTIGLGAFPTCELYALNGESEFVPLTDGFQASGTTLRVALKKNGAFAREFGLYYFQPDQVQGELPAAKDVASWPDRLVFDIPLGNPNEEKQLGFKIGLIPEGQTAQWSETYLRYLPKNRPAAWADFQWITVKSGAAGPPPAYKEIDLGDSLKLGLVLIGPGSFTMGCPSDEDGRWAYDWPPCHVTLTKSFYMGATPVTQAQWLKVMEKWPGSTQPEERYGVGDSNPAYYISWYEAVSFCNKLSEMENLEPCYTSNLVPPTTIASNGFVYFSQTANGYRLPTEAEREYAHRAGTTTRFYWGTSADYADMNEYCWYDGNSTDVTSPVAQKKPNPWGLYDMAGNISEWCNDGFENPKARENLTDPYGPSAWGGAVIRGRMRGSFSDFCRSAFRDYMSPKLRSNSVGFRVVRTVP